MPPQVINLDMQLQPKERQLLDMMEGSNHQLIGFGGARGGSKQIDVNEYIPVPLWVSQSGFKRMGEMQVGDDVFTDKGSITQVVAVTVPEDAYAYELEFNSGEKIVCDPEHLWRTTTKKDRVSQLRRTDAWRSRRRQGRKSRAVTHSQKPGTSASISQLNREREYAYLPPLEGEVKTAQEIVETLTVQSGREVNHAVDVALPIELPEAHLPIEPYLFGLWLGDGASGSTQIGMAEDDMREILQYLPTPAWMNLRTKDRKTPFLTCRWDGIRTAVRALGIWGRGNKSIPPIYLRASKRQRIALLQGLMDTDGCAAHHGQVSFTSIYRALADGFSELVSSLGIKTTMTVGRAKCNGIDHGEAYKFKFVSQFPVFRLARKVAKQSIGPFRATTRQRYIKTATMVGKRRMRCITVADPSGMYLVGKTMIPTHNSHGARTAAIMRRLKYRGSSAMIFRKNYDDLYQNHILEIQKEWPELYAQCWNAEHKQLTFYGGMILFRYADTISDVLQMKGPGYDDLFIDEASDLEPSSIEHLLALNRTTRVDLMPKTVLTFNPGGPAHSYLKKLFVTKDWTPEERALNPAFLQSYAWDNIFWVKRHLLEDGVPENELDQWYDWPQDKKIAYLLERSSYGKILNKLPPDLRKQWLYGLWDDFSGQMFPLKHSVHVVPTFKVPSWWQKWGGNDPGFNDPGVWHGLAADQDNNVYIYREHTFRDRTHTYSQQARIVAAATKDDEIPYWVTGGDAMADISGGRTGQAAETIVDHYLKGGLSGFVIGDHAKGCLKRRASVIHEYLSISTDGKGVESARLKIMDCCKELIETLPALVSDPSDREQALPCSIDHAYESMGRSLQYRHALTLPQKKKWGPGTMGSIDGSNDREEELENERESQPNRRRR